MSRPVLKPVPRSTVVDAVTEQIRGEILSGSFEVGARLPAERDLALQLGVNRLTLRAALARLETLGLIQTQHGTGSVVQDYREHGGFETLVGLLRVAKGGDGKAYSALARDLLELRRVLACETVALACERRTADDLARLREAAAAQLTRVKDVVAFARGDIEFARLVVRAARNIGLELLLNTLGRFPYDDPTLARLMYPNPRAQSRHYTALIAVIEARDAEGARVALRTVLESIDRTALARLTRHAAGELPRRRVGAQPKEE